MGRMNKGRWRPGGETLEVITAVLSEHWRSAAKLTPTRLFWQAPARWLTVETLPPAAIGRPHHFATGGRLIR